MKSEIGRSIDSLVRDALSPVLAAAGFRRQARTFRRSAGDAIHVVSVQGSKYNAGAEGEFTMNLGVYFPAAAELLDWPGVVSAAPGEAECLVRQRIGPLMPGRQDHWWSVNARTDLAALGEEVANVWRRHGAAWFETVPDLRAAGERLAAERSFYLAAVAALAAGDRPLAALRVAEALARFPDVTTVRRWGVRHGFLNDAAVV